jgi:hypothetical protein
VPPRELAQRRLTHADVLHLARPSSRR